MSALVVSHDELTSYPPSRSRSHSDWNVIKADFIRLWWTENKDLNTVIAELKALRGFQAT